MDNNMNQNQMPPQMPPQMSPQMPQQPPMQNFGGQNRPPKKKKPIWAWIVIAIVALIGIPAFIEGFSGDDTDKPKQEEKISKQDAEADIIADLKGNQEYMDSLMVRAKQTSAPDMLISYVRDVKNIAEKKIIDSTYMDIYSKPEVVSLMDENSAKAKKILPELMVTCRKQYAQNAKNKLWEEDIDIETSNGGTTITFIGSIFASRKIIKQWQNKVGPQLEELGFKRAEYKWIKHDPDYTYFDL